MNGPIPNVSRHNTEDSQGWYVRIRRKHRVKRRYFSDKKYGGRMQSLDAAVKYRNGLAAKARDGRLKAQD